MCGISTFKKFLQYYDKNKKKPFLSCRIVIKKRLCSLKRAGRYGFLPEKIRDLLTSMKILHTQDSQGDLLTGGQTAPPQRWVC